MSTESRFTSRPFLVQPAAGQDGLGGAEAKRARPGVIRQVHVEPDVRLGGKPGNPEEVDLEPVGLRETRPTRHAAGMFWAQRVVIVTSWSEMFESCSASRAVCAAARSAEVRPPEPTAAVTIRLTCRTLGDGVGATGMRSKARLAVRSLRSPPSTGTTLLVTNEIATAPPSPRQMQVAAFRSSFSQKMFGYRTMRGN